MDEVPPIWVDRAGMKANITEVDHIGYHLLCFFVCNVTFMIFSILTVWLPSRISPVKANSLMDSLWKR